MLLYPGMRQQPATSERPGLTVPLHHAFLLLSANLPLKDLRRSSPRGPGL